MPSPRAIFGGAVLTGGRSTRMGRDKALIQVDGTAMAARVAQVLRSVGADPVVAIGGDTAALTDLGLSVVPDDAPGQGPLAAIATALRHVGPQPVLVAPCDLVAPTTSAFLALRDSADDADVRIAAAAEGAGPGRLNYVFGWWRPSALPAVEAALNAGQRAVRDALKRLDVSIVTVDEAALRDADAPEDLPTGGCEER
ncbi:MAG: molybdenum cofactor guanylyltransferase [Acidimicrobiales bacterium]|nr:molybdenum cofactor guanylyltransferase [Acidimicrobiales bacterium]